jgi:hypothetical protein
MTARLRSVVSSPTRASATFYVSVDRRISDTAPLTRIVSAFTFTWLAWMEDGSLRSLEKHVQWHAADDREIVACYQSNFTPTRITRGETMLSGRSHDAPELTVMFCSALLLVRL